MKAGKSKAQGCWQDNAHPETSFFGFQAIAVSLCAHLAFPRTCALREREGGLSLPFPVMSPIKLRPHPSDFN